MAHYRIINTGGTIGMAATDQGLAPQPGLLREQLTGHPDLAGWREHDLSWDEWEPLIDSSDIRPGHWYRLRDDILASDADAFLIIHGTDTLAYTAAALSFLLAGSGKTVILTGSMTPLSQPDNDGIPNLNTALDALTAKRPEVCVAFSGRVLPASRITKADTTADDAFLTPNWSESLWDQAPGAPETPLGKQWRPAAIGLQILFPGMPMDGLMSMVERNYRALVLNTYGSGNLMNDDAMRRILGRAHDQGIPVFVRSQCLHGEVHLGQYAASSLLTEIGAVSCGGMPLEAVLTKLQVLCSEYDRADQIVEGFKRPWAREWQSLA
ncbi:asparaginase [Saccharospirillum salsuginis]|uniref:L-asparaginase 1 n=1 Tax=Saccharospirillum salsuginis TaxID=418750 RepID=A0A918NFU4_9GAMM|nr:asparaginase [Saccharospirillum salsuginis]GGX64373.1 L-asparaginase 1 [Saccharospirillum salsuginis]